LQAFGSSERGENVTVRPGNSLERILAVLEVFTEDRLEWTPDELMATLGYSRPTLYRYLKTLKEAGFLVSSPQSGFTLGPKVVEMDFLLRKSDPLILGGQAQLDRIVRRYSATALLVRWYGSRMLCVASACSAPDPVSSYPRGRPMPMGRGAIARSIVAFLPRQRLLQTIDRMFDDFRAVGLGETTEAIEQSFRAVRRAGCAIAFGEVTPGVVGVAAPVFDAGRSPVGSFCVTIAQTIVDENALRGLAADVVEAAQSVTESLAKERGRNSTEISQGENNG
jgi:DNA-binding IclR family transcriptional regulator